MVGLDLTQLSSQFAYNVCSGTFRLEPLKRDARQKIESRKYIPWLQTQGAKAVNSSEGIDSRWTACRFAIASSGDKCLVGSWVFAKSPFNAS
jgi:hypothetical protein